MLTLRRRGRVYYLRGTVRLGHETHVVKEHATGCDRREDAEAYRAKLEHQIRQEAIHGQSGRARCMTFADCGMLYLNRPGGLHRNDIWRVGELNRYMGDHSLERIMDGWALFKEKRCRGLAASTVGRFRDTLQAAMNYAGREREFQAPQIPRPPPGKRRERFLTPKERDRLLAAYAEHVQPIAEMLCYQGCRTQEALQLDWRHVDLDVEEIYFDKTKNGHPRSVPIHPRVLKTLRRLFMARGRPDSGHVFLNVRGKPYADTRTYRLAGGNPLRCAHSTACKRAGITDFHPHDWRHHWAVWCFKSGIDLEAIKKMGGWRSLRSLERYTATSAEHLKEAIRKLK